MGHASNGDGSARPTYFGRARAAPEPTRVVSLALPLALSQHVQNFIR
jgi:hypothetical protein